MDSILEDHLDLFLDSAGDLHEFVQRFGSACVVLAPILEQGVHGVEGMYSMLPASRPSNKSYSAQAAAWNYDALRFGFTSCGPFLQRGAHAVVPLIFWKQMYSADVYDGLRLDFGIVDDGSETADYSSSFLSSLD